MLAGLLLVVPPVQAQTVLANGISTISLSRGANFAGATPMALAWNPVTGQYYGANGGNDGFSGFVWDAAGALLQSFAPIGFDIRGVNYRASNQSIEFTEFSTGAVARAGLDASGLYTGGVSPVLASMALPNGQSYGVLDEARNRYYARSGTLVHVIDGTTGALDATVNLDFLAAGNPLPMDFSLGFDVANDLFIVASSSGRADVFRTDGSFLGTSLFAAFAPTQQNFNMGYSNGQLFVFDANSNAYNGYRIIDANVVVPEPSTFALLAVGLAGIALRARRRERSAS